MSRPKKYTRKSLETAVGDYFASIAHVVDARDKKGGLKLDDAGSSMRKLEFVTPPCVASLCLFLGIDKSTWANYGNDPKLRPVVDQARLRMEAYLETELLARRKGVEGVKFALQNNYGWRERQSLEADVKSVPPVMFGGEDDIGD